MKCHTALQAAETFKGFHSTTAGWCGFAGG